MLKPGSGRAKYSFTPLFAGRADGIGKMGAHIQTVSFADLREKKSLP